METRAKEKKREMEKLDELFRMGYVTENQYKERRTALEKGRSQDHYQHERADHFAPSTASFDTHSPSSHSLATHSVDQTAYSSAADSQWEVYVPSLWASTQGATSSPAVDKGKEEEREERPMRWGDFEGDSHVSSSSRWADMVDDISEAPFAELREASWMRELGKEMSLPYFTSLMETLENQSRVKEIFPPRDEVFAAYELTPLPKVKVVIIGQVPFLPFSFSLPPFFLSFCFLEVASINPTHSSPSSYLGFPCSPSGPLS
jgi:hypothetical protein